MSFFRYLSYRTVLTFVLLVTIGNPAHAEQDIWQAAASGDVERIQSLLDSGAKIDALHHKTRRTPLMEAAINNQHQAVRLLVESGASLEAYCSEDSTALGYAAQGGDKALVEYLLTKGADINGQREGGETPLMRAAKLGQPEVLQLLIDKGADLHFKARFRLSAIHSVTLEKSPGKAEKTKILIKAGANPSIYSTDGYTPMMYAANWGNHEVVQALLDSGVSPSEGNGVIDVLEIAFKQSDYELARLLIDAGANLKKDPEFSAALAYSVNYGQLDLAKHLIELGVPISRYGSGLYGAAMRGHHDCVELLSDHGSTLTEKSWLKIYETILDRSYVRSHIAITRSMRLDGAKSPEEKEKILSGLQPALDLLLAAHQGRTEDAVSLTETVMSTEPWAIRDAVIYAKNEGRIDTIRALQPLYYKAKRLAERKPNDLKSLTSAAKNNNAALMKHLLEKKDVDPNYGDKNEYSPIEISIEGQHVELVKLLLDNGANPDINPGKYGRSPLALACYRGTPEIVKLLIDAGADPDEGGDGFTPLYFAASGGSLENVKQLLEAGAEINLGCPGLEKCTALIEAAEKGHLEIVEFLLSKGANPNQADEDGNTPLSMATANAKTEIARALIRAGATPPDDIEDLRAKITDKHISSTRRVKELLDNGADPNALTEGIDGRKRTPLGFALVEIYPKHEVVQLLLDAGADLKLVKTPLLRVTTMRSETLELLIKLGADVNRASSIDGGTRPLHMAAAAGKLDLVRRLLDAGADPELRTEKTRLSIEQHIITSNRRYEEIYRKKLAGEVLAAIEQWEAEQAEKSKKPGDEK